MTSARALRDAFEPFHAACYFAPEIRSRYVDELGQHPWASYFAQRAAPMGAVDAATVTATFYGFSPRLVAKSIPSIWSVITPTEAIAHRLEATGGALKRLIGSVDSPIVDEATELARRAIDGCEFAGRPLAAAHHAVGASNDPLVELWRLITVLREYRGDGHVTALVHIGLAPVESLVTSHGFGDMTPDTYRRVRGWSEDEWAAGFERCRDSGWIDGDGHLTDAGTAVRWEVESETDRLFDGPVEALGERGSARLTELMAGLSSAVVAGGGLG